ncbi:MAG TPA: SDR family NAD(P)-dependent oxidoreductase, partial [Acidimicrobiales bacterium]|nr:SDR family NAD(P)-dependent oxidoreductase [Acidimicrobiales bacterium]
DVTDAGAVDALAAATLERFGRVDVVCNNAGVVEPAAPSWEQGLDVWRWTLDVALLGVVHGIRAFVPLLIARGSGHVLNTASVGGLIPLPMHGPYNAAKHAVVGLTETLRAELRSAAPDIGATVLCPGMVATSLAESSWVNRPDGVPGDSEPPASIAETMSGYAGLLAPGDVAAAALAGIEADRLHVIVGGDSVPVIRARLDSVAADLP